MDIGTLLKLFQSSGSLPVEHVVVESSGAFVEPAPLGHSTLVGRLKSGGAPAFASPDAIVHPIAKSKRNPFGDMITVGRASNNDIILSDANVSKFHAYFRVDGDVVKIHDTGSTNGTRVDGRPAGKEGIALSTLARIELGPSRNLIFIARGDLKEWLGAIDLVARSPGAPSSAAPDDDTRKSAEALHHHKTTEQPHKKP